MKLDTCKIAIAIILYFAFLSEKIVLNINHYFSTLRALPLGAVRHSTGISPFIKVYDYYEMEQAWKTHEFMWRGKHPKLFPSCNLCKVFKKTLSGSSIYLEHYWSSSSDKVYLEQVKRCLKNELLWHSVTAFLLDDNNEVILLAGSPPPAALSPKIAAHFSFPNILCRGLISGARESRVSQWRSKAITIRVPMVGRHSPRPALESQCSAECVHAI